MVLWTLTHMGQFNRISHSVIHTIYSSNDTRFIKKKKNTSMLKSKSPTGLFIPFVWLVILKRHSNQSGFSYYVYTISENLIKYLIINATPSRRVNTLEDVHVRWFSGNHCHCCFSMSLNCTYISFWTVGKNNPFFGCLL